MSSTLDNGADAVWLKSSYSGGEGGNCLEWAPENARIGSVPVRDSKDADGPTLTFSAPAFEAFIRNLKHG